MNRDEVEAIRQSVAENDYGIGQVCDDIIYLLGVVVEQRDRITALETGLRACRVEHKYVEDCWYSCPKAPEGCCDDGQGDECNCGADVFNARIDALLESTVGEETTP